MQQRPWQRELRRRIRKPPNRTRSNRFAGASAAFKPARSPVSSVIVTILVGLGVAVLTINLLERKLQPVLTVAATAQTQNTITSVLEQAVVSDLSDRQMSYSDLVTIERDADGNIVALTTDMASMNLLRAELVETVLETLEEIDVSEIRIPIGSLFDSELLWARGPSIRVRAMRIGTISAEFNSEFTSAGVNQTRHCVWLDLSVPMTVLLPGGSAEVPVNTRLCVAETVIVGQVPDTYLTMEGTGVG